MPSSSSRIAVVFTSLALLAASCGSGDEPAADTTTTAPTTEASTTTSTAATEVTTTTEASTTTQAPTTEAPTTEAPADTTDEGPDEPVTQSVIIGGMITVLSPPCFVHPEFGTGSGAASFGIGLLGPTDSDPPVAITDETVFCAGDGEEGLSYYAFATESASDASELSAWFSTTECRAVALVDSWVVIAATFEAQPANGSFLALIDLLGGELVYNCG